MKNIWTVFIAIMLTISAFGQSNPLWLRYTAISPDGKTILFTYKGDIYSVPSDGGTAVPLTLSESYEFSPRWSRDGKSIAFASDRYGNFDVFIMPSSGGEGKRLTFYSGNELPCCFTADNNAVMFSAYRQDMASNAQFPVALISELYSVPVTGGKVSMVLPTPALDAALNPAGDKLIFHDIKGYENLWRKHHTSSITHDIWVYDLRCKKIFTTDTI